MVQYGSDIKGQSSKCPYLPGFTHWVNPGKPGLGFKPYFGKKWGILKKRRKDNRLILLYKGLKGKARIPTDGHVQK